MYEKGGIFKTRISSTALSHSYAVITLALLLLLGKKIVSIRVVTTQSNAKICETLMKYAPFLLFQNMTKIMKTELMKLSRRQNSSVSKLTPLSTLKIRF